MFISRHNYFQASPSCPEGWVTRQVTGRTECFLLGDVSEKISHVSTWFYKSCPETISTSARMTPKSSASFMMDGWWRSMRARSRTRIGSLKTWFLMPMGWGALGSLAYSKWPTFLSKLFSQAQLWLTSSSIGIESLFELLNQPNFKSSLTLNRTYFGKLSSNRTRLFGRINYTSM